jgi:hypothetical protein
MSLRKVVSGVIKSVDFSSTTGVVQGLAAVHLFNCAAAPQTVTVCFDSPVTGYTLSPDKNDNSEFSGSEAELEHDVHTIMIIGG